MQIDLNTLDARVSDRSKETIIKQVNVVHHLNLNEFHMVGPSLLV